MAIDREQQWDTFIDIVRDHIVEYTIPQYGDNPNDPVESWDVERCMQAIGKYVARSTTSRRGGDVEKARDLLKIAHFSCIAFHKLMDEFDTPKYRDIMGRLREGR